MSFKDVSAGMSALGSAKFSYVTFFGGTTFRCMEPQVEAFQNPLAIGPPRCCAEASGDGTRRYVLIGSTHWVGSPPQADPIVALHSD